MRILILGNSHTFALQKAAAGSAQFEVHRLGETVQGVSGKEAGALAKSLAAEDVLVLSVGGTMHNPFSLLRHPEPFGVMVEGEEDCDTPIIPQSVIRDMFALPSWSRKPMIESFKAMTAARVFHIATPPPMADHEFIMQRRILYRGNSLAEYGLNPAPFRLKIWEIEMRVMADICRECGVGLRRLRCNSSFARACGASLVLQPGRPAVR